MYTTTKYNTYIIYMQTVITLLCPCDQDATTITLKVNMSRFRKTGRTVKYMVRPLVDHPVAVIHVKFSKI